VFVPTVNSLYGNDGASVPQVVNQARALCNRVAIPLRHLGLPLLTSQGVITSGHVRTLQRTWARAQLSYSCFPRSAIRIGFLCLLIMLVNHVAAELGKPCCVLSVGLRCQASRCWCPVYVQHWHAPDPCLTSGQSPRVTQQHLECMLQADTAINFTTSADNIVYGENFTLTAVVSAVAPSTAGGTPTGCASCSTSAFATNFLNFTNSTDTVLDPLPARETRLPTLSQASTLVGEQDEAGQQASDGVACREIDFTLVHRDHSLRDVNTTC